MMIRYFSLSFILLFSCTEKHTEKINFDSYNIIIKEKYIQYDFNRDLISVHFHSYLNTTDTLQLSAESKEKIIQSFFNNHIEEINGDKELSPQDEITMPPSLTEIAISKNGEIQSYFKVYYEYENNWLFPNKEFKRIKRFKEDIYRELKKNKKYNLFRDSIPKIQEREGIFEL